MNRIMFKIFQHYQYIALRLHPPRVISILTIIKINRTPKDFIESHRDAFVFLSNRNGNLWRRTISFQCNSAISVKHSPKPSMLRVLVIWFFGLQLQKAANFFKLFQAYWMANISIDICAQNNQYFLIVQTITYRIIPRTWFKGPAIYIFYFSQHSFVFGVHSDFQRSICCFILKKTTTTINESCQPLSLSLFFSFFCLFFISKLCRWAYGLWGSYQQNTTTKQNCMLFCNSKAAIRQKCYVGYLLIDTPFFHCYNGGIQCITYNHCRKKVHTFLQNSMQHVPAYSPLQIVNHLTKGPHENLTKKPEKMLVQNYVSSSRGQEETSVEVSVSQKHSQPSCKNWKTSNQQNAYKAHRPNKQRKTILGHPLSAHICNGYQKVDRPQNTSNTGYVQTKNSQVYRSTGMALCTTKRRVRCPPYPSSLFHQSTLLKESHPHWEYPKRNVIHPRKCHIWSTNHNRNQPVSKSSHECGHNNKEEHKQTVGSNQYVIELSISCQNTRTCTPLLHTNLQTHCCCNNTGPPCKYQIHHANIFGISTTKPSNKLLIPFIGRSFHKIKKDVSLNKENIFFSLGFFFSFIFLFFLWCVAPKKKEKEKKLHCSFL